LYVGEYLTGTGIPAGDTVASTNPAAGTITLNAAATTSGSQSLTFDKVTLLGYRVIDGQVDLNRDGAISSADTTSTLAGHPSFDGFSVISGKIDVNNDGRISGRDSGSLDVELACDDDPTIIPGQSDVGIAMTDSSATYTPGSTVTYTITVTNN